MTKQVELRIDVTDAAALGEPAHVTAVVILPEPEHLRSAPLVCFAKSGAGYSRLYYSSDLPGPGRGAQGPWHAERGWIFAAIDTLGCGTSSQHDPERLDFATVCAAARAAEDEILLRLANGVLLDGFPPVHQPVVIGIGQSLGGHLAIYQQARFESYDGVAVLGVSAVHAHPVSPPGEAPIIVPWYPRDVSLDEMPEPLNASALAAATGEGLQTSAWSALAWGFHYDDVPQDVVEQDLLHYDAIARRSGALPGHDAAPWNSYTTPQRAARSTLTPGTIATEAAAVAVPVLCAMGVRDLVPDPAGETRAFRSAPSVDLFICPRMGHMHNFAGTRALFWERIHSFGEWCAAMKRAG